MFVLSKRNIDLPWAGGTIRLARDVMGTVPDEVADTPYFKALLADGKVVVSGKSDKETQTAAEKKVRTRRGKTTTEE